MRTTSKSTIWLDFINYVLIPFYILTSSIELIKNIKTNILISLALLIFIIYIFITLFYLIKREKKAYYLLFPFYIVSYIGTSIYFISKYGVKNNIYYLLIIILGILWCIFNFIYTLKRKKIFYKHSVAHIKKCPGCNRIIPISMLSCGKCNYSEVENGDN